MPPIIDCVRSVSFSGLLPGFPNRGSPLPSCAGVQDKQAFLPWKEYRYEELLSATGHFSDGNLLGEGAFGRVYRAKLPNGTPVAVKQLKTGPRVKFRSGFH